MTRLIAALAEIAPRYPALLCDLWGCLHNGHRPYPAAVAALQAYRSTGGRVILVTNAPRPSRFVMASLDRMGVPRDCWDDIVSSGDAAQAALMAGAVGHRVWHLGPDKDDGFFDGATDITRVPLDQAQGIVCTGPFDELTETPDDYRDRLTQALGRGLPLLCANPDIVVDMDDRRIYCAGAIAALYDQMGGRSLYYGKPHAPIYHMARDRLAALDIGADAALLAVGDGIATDVAGGVAQGIDTLFVTNGLAAGLFGPDAHRPDGRMLADWLAAQGHSPTWAIPFLR